MNFIKSKKTPYRLHKNYVNLTIEASIKNH